MSSLPAALRRARILERIERDGGVTVAELARDHAVSNMTAHRDLELLAGEGLVERVRGGARAIVRASPAHATAWEQRVGHAAAAKAAIAEEAAALVGGGSTVFLDASSTALAVARRLMADPPFDLTLVTNSPAIVYEIHAEPLHVVICPGELDQHTRAISGRWTVEFLLELNFDLAFVSAAGLTTDAGLTTSRRPLADVLNAARAGATTAVGLIDATKFERASLISIVPGQDLDLVISDGTLDPAVAERYRRAGITLRVAGAGGDATYARAAS